MHVRTVAVVIGINGYSAWDRGSGRPLGTSDLEGAVNDAVGWGRLLRRLGCVGRDLRLLLAPGHAQPAHPDLPPRLRDADCHPPDRQAILAAAAWLRSLALGNPNVRGVFVFAGHGDVGAHGAPVLCPCDVVPDGHGNPVGAVSVAELVEILGGGRGWANITLVLDACHGAGANVGDGRRRSLRSTAGTREAVRSRLPIFSSCRGDERSYEIPLGREVRGAFSWALGRVIQRWGLGEGLEGEAVVRIANADAARRTRALLRALGVEQTPSLDGPAREQDQVLFGVRPGDSSVIVPEAPPPLEDRELWPGTYDIVRPVLGGHVKALGALGEAGWAPNRMYWFFAPDTNPLAGGPFEIVPSAQPPVLVASEADLVHPNAVFGTGAPPALSSADTWYRWTRRIGAVEEPEGWLGVKRPANGGAWTLTWVRPPGGAGTFARLYTGQRFGFTPLADPAGIFEGMASVAIVVDVSG